MSSILHIDGTEYHPAPVAAKQLGYTKEYLLMLAKQGKIDGRKIANKWYVWIPSAQKYFAEAHVTQEDRRRSISAERKHELQEHTAHRIRDEYRERRIAHRAPALVEATAVLVIGLMLGTTGYAGAQMGQRASVASASDFIDTVALSLYRAVVPAQQESVSVTAPSGLSGLQPVEVSGDSAWTGSLVHSPVQAVQDSFSDTVEVSFDVSNPSVAVVTPVFESGEGEEQRFLLTPIEPEATP